MATRTDTGRGHGRRNLLAGAAATMTAGAAASASGATTATPPRATGRPMPDMERPFALPEARRVGYAVVGLGKLTLDELLGAFAASRRSRIAALVSGDRAKAERVADRIGLDHRHLYDYAGFDRIGDDPTVDAVFVVLPNGLHAEYTVRAFRAGKHVLCEKPMANTPEECEAMIRAGRDAGRRLMIAYRQRFEPHGLAARGLIEAGRLGRVRLVTSDHHRHLDPRDPSDQWRTDRMLAGGGSLVDIGLYSLQAARMMTGEEPVGVSAAISSDRDDPRFRAVEDMVQFSLRFPSGALAHLSSSYTGSRLKRIEVLGTEATATLDPGTEYRGNRLRLRREQEVTELPASGQEQFSAEIDHMSECILGDRAPRTPGEEGLRDVRLMRAIYAAAEAGRWLTLRPDGSHEG